MSIYDTTVINTEASMRLLERMGVAENKGFNIMEFAAGKYDRQTVSVGSGTESTSKETQIADEVQDLMERIHNGTIRLCFYTPQSQVTEKASKMKNSVEVVDVQTETPTKTLKSFSFRTLLEKVKLAASTVFSFIKSTFQKVKHFTVNLWGRITKGSKNEKREEPGFNKV